MLLEYFMFLYFVDERNNDQVPAGPSPMIDWTPQMDRAFIDLMLEHSQEGSMFGQAFSEQAWSHVIISFNERFKLQCGRSVLEDRYVWWMKQYGEIYDLLNHGGFMWNESQQLITAEDDLWEAYGKVTYQNFQYRTESVFKCHF